VEEHELLLLGLLDQEGMHGYKMHEFLERRLQYVPGLTKATAYRLLDRLYRRGLIDRRVEREGRRPERLVYWITDAGRRRFEELLRRQLALPARPVHPGDVALFFSHRIPIRERIELLRTRLRGLEQERERLSTSLGLHAEAGPARLVMEHSLAHIDTEIEWLSGLISRLEGDL
jgi:DNA-binding PadR family transcriptional regulator